MDLWGEKDDFNGETTTSIGILPREGVEPLFDCHEKADVFGIGADLSGLSQVRDVLKMAYETGFGAWG